jgi:TetR/AcrR family transcriptional regulator, transcriptional repressor for nem operon
MSKPAAHKTPAPKGRREQKAETHNRIMRSAGKIVRRAGLSGASVPRVMRGAGLTVGGFYAHFRSKRAMDAQVITRAMTEVREQWFAGLDESAGLDFLARAVKRYLSPSHRDNIDGGCVMPASISELTRADRATRLSAGAQLEQLVGAFATHAPEAQGATARERALATLALLIGALTMARMLRGHPLSDEILRASVKWALPEHDARLSRKK